MTTNASAKPVSRQIGKMTLTLKSDTEVELTRTFNAPRALVFEAHSKAAHVRQWWGRKDGTMPVCDMDFQPGGAWRYVIRQPDGREHGFHGSFVDIVRPEWFSWMFGVDGMPGEGLEIYTFTEHDGKTTLTTLSKFPSIEVRDAVIATGMEQGAAELFDRLEEYVTGMAH